MQFIGGLPKEVRHIYKKVHKAKNYRHENHRITIKEMKNYHGVWK